MRLIVPPHRPYHILCLSPALFGTRDMRFNSQLTKHSQMLCHICNTQYQRYLYGTFVGMVEGQMYSEELRNIVKSGIAAAVVGMVYGGLPGARHARERFIQLSQAEIYQNRVDAVRSAHNAAIRGFVRFGWRWSWRVAICLDEFVLTQFNSEFLSYFITIFLNYSE
uniref:Complex I assembly factor TIMMDC1, mitochondrial n=1 Tax=Sinocyclocheilus anshuiensis TaxID=1608454 RepID=A0A671SBZ5_9TELE